MSRPGEKTLSMVCFVYYSLSALALKYAQKKLAEMDNDFDTLKNSKRPPEEMEASDTEALTPTPKRQKVSSTSSLLKYLFKYSCLENDVPCSIPVNRIEDIKNTVPERFLVCV